jgi:DNA/RNA endonuclease YhcR with UshA esterase domain
MKPFALFAIALCLAATAIPSRADETNTPAPTIGVAQAADFIGKQVTVTGLVAQVSSRPGLTFLNFGKPFPKNTFTVIVRDRNTNQFDDLSELKGKAVSVKGKVIDYKGKPEIELTTKSQLKLLSGTK